MPVSIRGDGLILGVDWGSVEGGLALLVSADLAGSSSHTFETCFGAAFDSYLVTFDGQGSAEADLRFRMRIEATDVSSAIYHAERMTVAGATVTAVNETAQTSGLLGKVGTSRSRVSAWVGGPYKDVNTVVQSRSALSVASASASIMESVSGVADTIMYLAMTVFPASGTLTGRLSVYGLTTTQLTQYPPNGSPTPLNLYDWGEEFLNTTGGWDPSTTSNGFSYSKNPDHLYMGFSSANSTYGSWVTNRQIDVTPYSRIHATFQVNDTMENMRFGLYSSRAGQGHTAFIRSEYFPVGLATYTKDISMVDASYYLGFYGGGANYNQGGGSWQLHKMWLE